MTADGAPRARKMRLDQLVVERGLAPNRSKAQALLLAGVIFSGERRLDKAGAPVAPDIPLERRDTTGHDYVSRGALKLVRGLEAFGIDPTGCVAADIGASTGGFTEVLLRRGAARVHAVDVGHGQLAWSLRNDPRVVVLERTNARHLTAETIPEPLDLVVCDASFISLELVLPAALSLTRPGAALVALIKPQFEAGREKVGKGGVVRDPAVHEEVCATIRDWLQSLPGWRVLGLVESPVRGPAGNVEFLIGARRSAPPP